MDHREEYLLSENFISIEIQESIHNHCYSNSIETAIQKMKNNEDRDHEDRDPEILIFNYVSDYLKLIFPNVLLNKAKEEQLNIIYEAITYFLKGRDRENQIVRTLSVLKRNHQLENSKIEERKSKVVNKILSLFV
jgi:ribonucleotide reductase beta subunit family protein with ferritin-like domain